MSVTFIEIIDELQQYRTLSSPLDLQMFEDAVKRLYTLNSIGEGDVLQLFLCLDDNTTFASHMEMLARFLSDFHSELTQRVIINHIDILLAQCPDWTFMVAKRAFVRDSPTQVRTIEQLRLLSVNKKDLVKRLIAELLELPYDDMQSWWGLVSKSLEN